MAVAIATFPLMVTRTRVDWVGVMRATPVVTTPRPTESTVVEVIVPPAVAVAFTEAEAPERRVPLVGRVTPVEAVVVKVTGKPPVATGRLKLPPATGAIRVNAVVLLVKLTALAVGPTTTEPEVGRVKLV